MKYYFYFLSVLFLIILLYKPSEKYTNYKKVVVTPSKYKYFSPIILYPNTRLNHYISKVIASYVPFMKRKISSNSTKILEIVNSTPNILGLVSEYNLLNYIDNNLDNNVRFICNIFYKHLTFISITETNMHNLENKSIGVIENSSSMYVLKLLEKLFKFKLVIIKKISIKNIHSILIVEKLDVISLFISHPNEDLENLFSQNVLNIFGTGDIPEAFFKKIIPNYKVGSIEVIYYIKERNYMIPTIEIYNVLVTHKNTASDLSYTILDKLYYNLSDVKGVGDNYLKKQTNYFNVNNIFSSDNKKIVLHSGTNKYYVRKGYSTNIDRNICRKYIGLQKCDPNKRLNPYRLL